MQIIQIGLWKKNATKITNIRAKRNLPIFVISILLCKCLLNEKYAKIYVVMFQALVNVHTVKHK